VIAVVQRVKASSVSVGGEKVAAVGAGLMILLGILDGDNEAALDKALSKILNLRIFADTQGKMNLSLLETGGELLVVSQFTLAASVKKGRRPSFDAAAHPAEAEKLYRYFIDRAAAHVRVAHGVFGAHMEVDILNDGPVTILVDSNAL